MEISMNQFEFMLGHSTTKAIHLVRRWCSNREKKNLYMVFIDLEKAYDKVSRKVLWRCLEARVVPVEYLAQLRTLYNSTNRDQTLAGFVCPVIDALTR